MLKLNFTPPHYAKISHIIQSSYVRLLLLITLIFASNLSYAQALVGNSLDLTNSGSSIITLTGGNGYGGRNRIKFIGNDLNVFESDGVSNGGDQTEVFSFYSTFNNVRTRSSELRVHGLTSNNWGTFLSMSHNGSHGFIYPDLGWCIFGKSDFSTNPGSRTSVKITGKLEVGIKAPILTSLYTRGVQSGSDYKFAVDGIGVFQTVAVTGPADWSDFVFDETYKLPTLQEVEKFYIFNKHLEGVPSKKQVENGYNLSEMDAILLQKVEELTLYVVQLQKEIEALKTKK